MTDMTDEQFNKMIASHITSFAQRRNWIEVRIEESSRGSLRDYMAGNLYIRICSDRGLIEIEIGSCADNLRAVSFYKDMLAPAPSGKWNLSVEQACKFIDEQWDWFMEYLGAEKSAVTVQRLDTNARNKR